MYNRTDREGVMKRLADELPTLEERHRDVLDVFREQALDIYRDRTACVDLLADIRLRAEFTVKFRRFLDALDMILYFRRKIVNHVQASVQYPVRKSR